MYTYWLKACLYINGEIQFMDFQARTIIIWLDAERREEFNSSGIIIIHSKKYAVIINVSSAAN